MGAAPGYASRSYSTCDGATCISFGDAQHAGAFLLVKRAREGARATTKSGKTRRVPLLPEAIAVVQDLAKGRACAPGDLVFPSPRGGVRSKTGYRTTWAAVLERAKIAPREGLGFKALRHTCATGLLAGWWTKDEHGRPKGWPIKAVSMMLGHSSVTVTERYAHALDATLFDLCKLHVSTEIGEAKASAPVSQGGDATKSEALSADTRRESRGEANRDARETGQLAQAGRITQHMPRDATPLTDEEIDVLDRALASVVDAEWTAFRSETAIRLRKNLRSRLGDLNPRPTVYETRAQANGGGEPQKRAGSTEGNGRCVCTKCGARYDGHALGTFTCPSCGHFSSREFATVGEAIVSSQQISAALPPEPGPNRPEPREREGAAPCPGGVAPDPFMHARPCASCKGAGEVLARRTRATGHPWIVVPCPECAA